MERRNVVKLEGVKLPHHPSTSKVFVIFKFKPKVEDKNEFNEAEEPLLPRGQELGGVPAEDCVMDAQNWSQGMRTHTNVC